jgi:uncharacterized protein (DUF983 family)
MIKESLCPTCKRPTIIRTFPRLEKRICFECKTEWKMNESDKTVSFIISESIFKLQNR